MGCPFHCPCQPLLSLQCLQMTLSLVGLHHTCVAGSSSVLYLRKTVPRVFRFPIKIDSALIGMSAVAYSFSYRHFSTHRLRSGSRDWWLAHIIPHAFSRTAVISGTALQTPTVIHEGLSLMFFVIFIPVQSPFLSNGQLHDNYIVAIWHSSAIHTVSCIW